MEDKKKSCQIQGFSAKKQFIESSLELLKILTFLIRDYFVFHEKNKFNRK